MKRRHFILLGLVMTLAFGNTRIASAQDVETLLMPGQVIAGHEEFETECSSCHKMFDKTGQRQLCMDCHEDVAADINTAQGFHGLFTEAGENQCATCHTDHKGRDADVVELQESTFDHDFTDFELLGSHLEVECDECHASDTRYREAPGTCNGCHSEDDVHKTALGTECESCHESTEWKNATFDHDSTGYPLLGRHKETECLDCHEDETYQNAPADCYSCHAQDDAHDGRSGRQCDNCHNPGDWTDTSFDHVRDTEFPLAGEHARLTCDDCHSEDPFQDEMDMACVACHLDDDEHKEHNGEQCDSCHNSSDWAESLFDHDRDTDYELHGAHQAIACAECHVEPIFDASLTTTCDSCHLDDDVHEESLGTRCENCHTEVSWEDPVFFDHDLTRFPLLGLHADAECEDCHATRVFTDVETDCVSCHRDEDPHRGHFDDSCDACHNPVAWDLWIFDHDVQTAFPLEGAHVDVLCEDCHRSPLDTIKSIDGSCGNCHRSDDVHDGEFGFDCGRCHTADSFREVRSLQ